MSKWIKFTGDKQPVPDGTPVKVKSRAGDINKGSADNFVWDNEFPSVFDIVAYKLRKGWQFIDTLDETVSGVIELMGCDSTIVTYKLDDVSLNVPSYYVLWRKVKHTPLKQEPSEEQIRDKLKVAQDAGMCVTYRGYYSRHWLEHGKSDWAFDSDIGEYAIVNNELTQCIARLRLRDATSV